MYLNSHAIKRHNRNLNQIEKNEREKLNTAVKMRECLSDLSL